jgi:hypothetical protein
MATLTAFDIDCDGLAWPHIRFSDVKAAAVNGGTFTVGAWQVRDLNTTVAYNGAAFASISGNVITIDAGTYYCYAYATAFAVFGHQARLEQTNNTPATLLLGTTEYASVGGGGQSRSILEGGFTIATGSTTLQLEHQCAQTKATNGLGVATNFSVDEIYSVVTLWKLAS